MNQHLLLPADESLADGVRLGVDALAPPLGLAERSDEIVAAIRATLGPVAERGRALGPAWPSDVCDDHGPFEFSTSFTRDESALRVLIERVPVPADPRQLQLSAAEASRLLGQRYGAHLERLEAVEDLFDVRDTPAPQFARWHALGFQSDNACSAKVYLNPQVDGNAADRCVAALRRLGFEAAESQLRALLARGAADEVKYFGLDLVAGARARAKVYVRHHDTTASELEQALGRAGAHAEFVSHFCSAMANVEGELTAKPVISCLSWCAALDAPTATVHVPIRAYVTDDEEARQRILAFMRSAGLPHGRYDAALQRFARRRLESGVGMQSYASLKASRGTPHLTIYLVPETYRVHPPRDTSAHRDEVAP